MKYKIPILIIISLFALQGMEKLSGKRSATEALAKERELEKKPAVEYTKSPLEFLPGHIQYEIVKALTKARGSTKRARLDNAAENIRSFFRTNRLFKSFENDQILINSIITELANNYADGDKIAAAIALGTESARIWMTTYLKNANQSEKTGYLENFKKNFLKAVRDNRLNVIDFLLSTFVLGSFWKALLFEAFLEATKDNQVTVINKILSHPRIQTYKLAIINAPNQAMETLLFPPVRMNRPQIVEILIAAGANVNHANDFHQTPLQFAAAGPYPVIVEKLLNAHADTNVADDHGLTALMLAIEHDSIETVNLLVNAGADVNHVDNDGHSVLWYALTNVKKNKDAIIKILIDNGAI